MKRIQSHTANVLPLDAVKALQAAAQTPYPRDSLLRVVAIEQATAMVKFKYPQFFRKDGS